jgi:homoserine O-succinyltransferase/O-acetyltransferase
MPVVLDRSTAAKASVEFRESDGRCLDIGLINNMPDTALESTERQFVELLEGAASDIAIRLKLYSLPDVPRSEAGRHYMRGAYSDITELWDSRLDGLIVTGTEPRTPALMDEPYWTTLTKIADWAERNAISTVWSCLAAHAAVFHLDGIRRHSLKQKRFGIFDCARVSDHPLLAGVPSPLRIAHSRWNELHEGELVAFGYAVLMSSPTAGVDTFVKQRNCLSVFFQGHPEYDRRALLREFRRDIGRFLRQERDTYPETPQGYFDDDASNVLAAFRERALSERREELLEHFPSTALEARVRPGSSTTRIYGNWLTHLSAQKAQRTTLRSYAASPRRRRNTESHRVQGLS